MKIRQYKSGDEPRLVALWNRALWADKISPELFRERLLMDPNISAEDFFVAEDRGGLAGAAIAFVRRTDLPWGYENRKDSSAGTGYLFPLVVDPPRWKGGAAKSLLAAGERHLRGLGARTVTVCEYFPMFFLDGVDRECYPQLHAFLMRNGYAEKGTTYRMGCDLRRNGFAERVRLPEAQLSREGITFATYRPELLLAVRRFLLEEFPVWISPFAYKIAVKAPCSEVTLALKGSNVVGYCQYNYYGHMERVGPFGIAKSLQGRNVGQVMVAHLLQTMSEAGYKFAYFDSTRTRQTKFFKESGFSVFSEKTAFRKALD